MLEGWKSFVYLILKDQTGVCIYTHKYTNVYKLVLVLPEHSTSFLKVLTTQSNVYEKKNY